jgi:ATP-dependent RNA helicase DDX19/DBP5
MTRDSNLLKKLDQMNFHTMTEFQEKALPILLSNPYPLRLHSMTDISSPRNMIGQSQSATGKTTALVLTMLSRIDYNLKSLQAICLAPTSRLANQIRNVIKTMDQNRLNLRTAVIPNAIVVVGTPEDVLDLLGKKSIDARLVKVLVIDEAGKMDESKIGHSIRVRKFTFFFERRD